MATVAENKHEWDGAYSWNERGDEWSAPWGGVEVQWYATMLPRIHQFVPTGTILEIACGYGRWTHYLKDLCQRLIVVDLSEECIDACRKRFASVPHVEYHVNDGRSLEMVPDASVDFAFSFDSLVHADASVLNAYVSQLGRKLRLGGTAFLHHSNLGEYRRKYELIRKIPKLEGALIVAGLLDPFLHWRDPGVSAGAVARFAADAGLVCVTQEIVHWRTVRTFIDCMSIIVKPRDSEAAPTQVIRNNGFMEEARNLRTLSRIYGRKAKSSAPPPSSPIKTT